MRILGKESDVKAAYKKIVDTWGASPEVLVYNAGPGEYGVASPEPPGNVRGGLLQKL